MTQAKQELQALLAEAEAYRQRYQMGSVMISVVGGGNGHAYANRGIDRIETACGAWERSGDP